MISAVQLSCPLYYVHDLVAATCKVYFTMVLSFVNIHAPRLFNAVLVGNGPML